MALEDSELEVWISRQVIREFLSALSRPQHFSQPVANSTLLPAAEELESQFLVAEDNRSVTTQLFWLLDTVVCGGKQLHDANALDKYERYLTCKGNKPMSVHGTLYRLKEFFFDRDGALTSLRPRECSALYQRLVSEPRKATNRPLAPDSHRNYLAESKSFLQWCVEAGFLSSNPLQQVKGQGRRRRGKAQLGIDESKKFNEKALELAQLGDPGASCVLVLLHKGPRATELINFRVRDLDDSGQLLWVREHAALSHLKTPVSKRALSLPAFLQPFLIELAAGRRGEEHLFGRH